MLYVYLKKSDIPNEFRLIRNVENEAFGMKFTGSEDEKNIVKEIDKGSVLSDVTFEDRFGYPLKLEYLSTGAKAGLCVLQSKENEVIDLVECGHNAIGAILSYCKKGKILVENHTLGIPDYTDGKDIDIRIGKYKFTSMKRLNYYLLDELGFEEPDLEIGGVELVS